MKPDPMPPKSLVANGRRTEKNGNAEMPLSPRAATGAGSHQAP
ncbi:MAG TPA: hypothetical protein VF224_16195 [Aestuariivirga sp.]